MGADEETFNVPVPLGQKVCTLPLKFHYTFPVSLIYTTTSSPLAKLD